MEYGECFPGIEAVVGGVPARVLMAQPEGGGVVDLATARFTDSIVDVEIACPSSGDKWTFRAAVEKCEPYGRWFIARLSPLPPL